MGHGVNTHICLYIYLNFWDRNFYTATGMSKNQDTVAQGPVYMVCNSRWVLSMCEWWGIYSRFHRLHFYFSACLLPSVGYLVVQVLWGLWLLFERRGGAGGVWFSSPCESSEFLQQFCKGYDTLFGA